MPSLKERSAIKAPSTVSIGMLGPMGCGIITGAGAVLQSMHMQTGQSLVVFGVGGVGMSAVLAARLVGASRIIAVDQNAARLDLAIDLGATHAIRAGAEVVADIRKIAPRGVDRSLNTTPRACRLRPGRGVPRSNRRGGVCNDTPRRMDSNT